MQMHLQDMARRLLAEGDLVHVTGKRGSILLPRHAPAAPGRQPAPGRLRPGRRHRFNVADLAIERHLKSCGGTPEQRLSSLQDTLKCGSNCGSCLPELRRMVRATPALAPRG